MGNQEIAQTPSVGVPACRIQSRFLNNLPYDNPFLLRWIRWSTVLCLRSHLPASCVVEVVAQTRDEPDLGRLSFSAAGTRSLKILETSTRRSESVIKDYSNDTRLLNRVVDLICPS